MKVSDAYPSQYLAAADLQNRNIAVVIDRVEYGKVGDDNKLILYFRGKEKGMVLNKTNANTISMVYGDDTDDWEGGDLVLFSTRVDFQGKSVDAIRLRVPPRKPQRAAAPVNAITSGRQPPVNGHRDDAPPPGEVALDTRGSSSVLLDDDIPFSAEMRG